MEITETTSAPNTETPQVTVVSQEEVNGRTSVLSLGLAPEVAIPAQTNSSEPETSTTAESGKEAASEESKEKWYDIMKFVMTPCGLGIVTAPVDDHSVLVLMLTEYYSFIHFNWRGSKNKKSFVVNGTFSIDSLEKAEVDEKSGVAALLKSYMFYNVIFHIHFNG